MANGKSAVDGRCSGLKLPCNETGFFPSVGWIEGPSVWLGHSAMAQPGIMGGLDPLLQAQRLEGKKKKHLISEDLQNPAFENIQNNWAGDVGVSPTDSTFS
jgi:hypothetical protein